ncbi:MAG: DUF2442 domain-containing protein [Blastocatellia bacterium]
MAKIKLGISDEEFERQYAEAVKRGKERLKTEPRAKSATYDPKTRRVIIELMNDCVFIIPVDLMQGLRGASDEDLMDFSLMPRGFDLHWHRLDAQFTVFGLMQGRFGTKRWMAELGRIGAAKTKRAASRASGGSRAAATTKNKRRSAA